MVFTLVSLLRFLHQEVIARAFRRSGILRLRWRCISCIQLSSLCGTATKAKDFISMTAGTVSVGAWELPYASLSV
ncbi:hypothetical protein BJV77DRAFT_1009748 [Russula vinacea]|nr:hypothetical protein BJV77DRAFT_1009748 [Russula vinacea]